MAAIVTDRRAHGAREATKLAGDRVRHGFDLPPEPWDIADRGWVCAGNVTDEPAVGAAVAAAARGASVVVVCGDERVRDLLLDDLERVGEVQVALFGPDPLDVLDDEQRALLEHLAAGESIADAASALFLSARTAERRVAAVRKALGVRTTAEAIALAGAGA